MLRRRAFERRYRHGETPWDTGITPPEVVAFIDSDPPPPPGRALDLGCGTGTNALYLARKGWQVAGVDFSNTAIEAAQRKSGGEGTSGVSFRQADVTRLHEAGIEGPFDFVLDIGCYHGIAASRKAAYVEGVAAVAAPGATFMTFAWGPNAHLPGRHPTREREIRRRFGGAFELVRIEPGQEPPGAAWFTLRRKEGRP